MMGWSYVRAKEVHMSTLTWERTRSFASRKGRVSWPRVPNMYLSSPEWQLEIEIEMVVECRSKRVGNAYRK
jgi:hypothetical protein